MKSLPEIVQANAAKPPVRHLAPCGSGTGAGCGRSMLWAEMKEEDPVSGVITTKRIPLDPSAPVYRIVQEDGTGVPIVVRDKGAMVSHFKTCQKASEFSSQRKPSSA